MMAKLTQYNETQPIFQQKPVASAAKGFDALAQVFGDIGKEVKDVGVELLEEHSQINLLQSKNAMNQAINKAKVQMINNPDLASEIADSTRQSLKTISETAMLNNNHRALLDSTASTYLDELNISSAKTQRKQLLNDTSYSIATEFPKSIQQIDSLYKSGKIKEANALQDNLLNTAQLALKIGAITPQSYQSIADNISHTTVKAERIMKMLSSGNASAAEFHQVNNSIYGNNNIDQSSLPSNEYTKSNAQYYDEETTKEKALSDVYTYGHLTNPMQIDNLSDDVQASIYMQWEGANNAMSHLQSGTNQIAIQERYKQLKDKTNLSLRERGELNYYKNYYNRLENGYFIDEMRKTTEGLKIYQQYMQNKRTIENSDESPERKAFDLHSNDTTEKQRYIALWNGMHGDPRYVKVMTKEEVSPVLTSFDLGQNPDIALKRIRATSSHLIPYLAESMDTGEQRSVVSIIGQAGDNISQGLGMQMIYGNQNGYQPKILQPDKTVSTRKKIEGLLVSNADINNAIMYLGYMPHDPIAEKEKGMSAASSTIQALANTALFKMDRAADYNLTNLNGTVQLIGLNMRKAYNIYTSSNIMFNRSTLKLDDQDLKSIGSYALAESYAALKSQTPESKVYEYMDIVDRQPLMVVNTPNNFIAVINSTTRQLALDKNGKPLFYHPYTESMLHAANENKDRESYEHYLKVLEYKQKHPFGNTFQ